MRMLAAYSRDPDKGFTEIHKSLGIHDKIVEAFETDNWEAIGKYFLEYMAYRQKIDPGATWNALDEKAKRPVLREIVDSLEAQGLVHGGMYTGAMGFGVMMLIPTDLGKEIVDGETRVAIALEKLKEWDIGDGIKPYTNMKPLNISLNNKGVEPSKGETGISDYEGAVSDFNAIHDK